MKSLTDKLKEIRDRADAATEGPWTTKDPKNYMKEVAETLTKKIFSQVENDITQADDNAKFIAHARTDIPKLLAVIEKLIEQREVYAERAGDQENYESDNSELLKALEDKK